MSDHVHTVDVRRPVRTVYDQWTQFESFPTFMRGVQAVTQIDDSRTRWIVDYAGVERQFDATITHQRPDRKVAWASTDGTHQSGVVTFKRLDDENTRVTLKLHIAPEGFVEPMADKLGFIAQAVEGDLLRFKEFIEERSVETGAWRGELPAQPAAPSPAEAAMEAEGGNEAVMSPAAEVEPRA